MHSLGVAYALELLSGRVGCIVLQDGTVLKGKGFGATGRRFGEIVFSTAMNGYTEALTDPSFAGQVLVLSYPLVGNYGVPPDFESHRIQVEALVISKLTEPSHYRSRMSLDEWLAENGVPGVSDVDTRFLIRYIREAGVMGCAVEVADEDYKVDIEELKRIAASFFYDKMEFKHNVFEEPTFFGSGDRTVAVVDFGIKAGIIRMFQSYNLKVAVFPRWFSLDEIMEYNPSGIVLGNGPGNPMLDKEGIRLAEEVLDSGIPVLGICLGHQLLALASGASVYKMKYGHRGINKPCRDLRSGKRVITLQNHGYAVDASSLEGTGFKLWFINCDDGSVEGLYHESKPVLTTQFHPEGSPGPRDASYVFDLFVKIMGHEGNNL